METCANCGATVRFERRNYQYTDSGLSNVVLQGVEVARCDACGSEDVILPFPERIHWAIARALVAENPARMTGEQLRFLRKHLGFSGEQLARHLGTDKTKISKWERGEDPIGKSTDRLVRLLVAELDPELKPAAAAVAGHFPLITDQSGSAFELRVDAATLRTGFLAIDRAA
jgi:putative transcriptional regulator